MAYGCLVGTLGITPSALADDLPALLEEERGVEDVDRAQSQTRVDLPAATEGVSPDTRVPVSHIAFRGGSVFPLATLARGMRSMVGRRVTVGELSAAAEDITRRYQEAGYPLSYAYLADYGGEEGRVTVVVVEGYIARSEIAIDNAAVAARVERLVARMQGERPLTRATFERYTALIERIPGARLAIKAPVPRTAGGGTTLRVEEREIRRVRLGGKVEGGDEDEYRLLAELGIQANTRHAEKLTFSGLLPIDSDDDFYGVAYRQALGSDGLRLRLSANRFQGQDSDTALLLGEALDVEEARTRDRYRLELDYPLVLSRRKLWEAGLALEHHDESLDYDYSFDGLRLIRASQRLSYSTLELSSRYRVGDESRLLELAGSLRQGVDAGSSRNRLRVGDTRVEGPEGLTFTRWDLQGRWLEQLAPRWRLTTRLAGFWSADDLPSAERGNYGGSRFGRGYPDGQAEGDYGYAGDIELRYLHALENHWLSSLEPYVLLDGARTSFHRFDAERELASAVAGVEFSNGRHYRLGVEYAKPIGDADQETGERDGRINARVSWRFGG